MVYLEMSSRMIGMVETSTNLASVKFTDDHEIILTTSQRSEIDGRKYMAAEMVEAVMKLAGADGSFIRMDIQDGLPTPILPLPKLLWIPTNGFSERSCGKIHPCRARMWLVPGKIS